MYTRSGVRPMSRFFWVAALVAVLVFTTSASAQRGGGRGQGKGGGGKNRDRTGDVGGDQGGGFRNQNQKGGDQGNQYRIQLGNGDQGGGPGGFGGRGMRGGDPNQFFDMLAKGKDVINRDELDPMQQRMFDGIAQRNGLTGNSITRQQFSAAMSAQASRMNNGAGPNMVVLNGNSLSMDADRASQVALYEWVADGRRPDEFQKMDRNDDGFLTVEEVLGYVRNGNQQPGVSTASMYASAAGPNNGRGGFGRGPGGQGGDMTFGGGGR